MTICEEGEVPESCDRVAGYPGRLGVQELQKSVYALAWMVWFRRVLGLLSWAANRPGRCFKGTVIL